MTEGARHPEAQAFLAIVDDTPECAKALRYVACRARRLDAEVILLRVVPSAPFLQWGRAQRAIAEEALAEAQLVLDEAARRVATILGRRPRTELREGRAAEAILAFLQAEPAVRMLVLAAAPQGRPGPLVAHFAGPAAGSLPCLVTIVPGGMADSELDRLA
ncbi:MAG: universal stress protein [Sphingomonadaceae bacterium]|uniref:universal stress protein n=1 Tax=Thermaurantiacus sp. TaxID=2820283 RepID=UPI00298F08E3|nr:universal stress protein [Thermaurantiacus sp.]MCS6986229.1 universal stress protein [Sphingomonadaceae bacterium]MDW8415675.1 universal stress protein [Thermaurantiacus sp.]